MTRFLHSTDTHRRCPQFCPPDVAVTPGVDIGRAVMHYRGKENPVPLSTTGSTGAEPTVAVLHQLVAVLDCAAHQAQLAAAAAGDSDNRLRSATLAIEAQALCDQAVELLPGGLYPSMDHPSTEDPADPVQLLRRAEQLATSLPVEQFPPGMSALIVRLIDTVRDQA